MELNIDHLIIEVTRKCNMRCPHCLRGAAQRITIPNQYVHKMFQLIDNISTLTITGGEPTLAMDTLEHIRNCIAYDNCDVNSFYMITNGKAINVEKVARWAADMLACCSDNEMSQIGFSFDQFHKETFTTQQLSKQKRNFYNLKEILAEDYGIYETVCGNDFISEHSGDSWNYNNLIAEGRAKYIGRKGNNINFFEEDTYEETIAFSGNELYLSSSGYIVAGCDWSYHSIDNNKEIRIAHIDDIKCTDDLASAISTYNKSKEVDLQLL